jgi:putative aldouronate transport system permease protein
MHPTGRLNWFARLRKDLIKDRWLYALLIPGMVYFLLFKYGAMFGLIIAFKDYSPFQGYFGSPFVGLKHYIRLFNEPMFMILFKNTLILAVYNIMFFFPVPIILALLLNEIMSVRYKKFVQTMIYIPHFISWPVVVSITYLLLTPTGGFINEILKEMGKPIINPLMNAKAFRPMIIIQQIWKESGWGTIIFLAALAGVNLELYEAATVDGANRLQKMIHVTFPAIQNTIITMFILRMGTFMDSGFEQIYLMLNSLNRSVGEVFDTYVYTAGLINGQFSYSTSVGLFKSTISLIMVITVNKLAKMFGEEGVY